MASRLKSSDHPQPWFSKKAKGRTTRGKKTVTTLKEGQNWGPQNSQENGHQQSRQQGHEELKGIDSRKRKKSGTAVTASPLDSALRIPENAVADIEEQRRKREEDAAVCGRKVKTVLTTGKRKIVSGAASNDSGEGEGYHPPLTALASGGGPSSPKSAPNQTWTG